VTEDPHVTARLRRALAAKADTIDPEPDRLDRIEEQLMSRTPLTDAQRWTVAGVAAVATLLVVALLVVSTGDDGDGDLATGTTSSSSTTTAVEETTTSTTEAPETTTTTTTFTPVVDPFAVAFPSPNDSRSFDAPASAARSFATDVLGFTELVLGSATPTGEATAEVVIQDREDGPETRVSVQQMEDGAWYVVGAATDDIRVATPTPGTSLASPFETTGEALAFEGNVEVLVLAQDDPMPIGQGVVTGSGTPPAGPFEGRIDFTPPPEPVAGVLVYRIHSPEDGRVVRATAVPVRLTPFTS
jgi:hypothetical protein